MNSQSVDCGSVAGHSYTMIIRNNIDITIRRHLPSFSLYWETLSVGDQLPIEWKGAVTKVASNTHCTSMIVLARKRYEM